MPQHADPSRPGLMPRARRRGTSRASARESGSPGPSRHASLLPHPVLLEACRVERRDCGPNLANTLLTLDNAESNRVIVERPLQQLSSTVEAAHHGANRAPHHLSDLLVGEFFYVAEHDSEPKLGGQRVERATNLVLND